MSLALARKYRPKNFASVAVQSHVSNTLKGAIARGRVAHGYLLCGPRGTGKTTLARVLAMALNCERRGAGADGEPCGECPSCQRIWSGSASLDVVEIDAASNRGVDDARDLRERAMYAPSGDERFKVYIVDEAHMLTREAWNALLKILEEPPPRVVFVFATTEPQKIAQSAAPVLSRLQRFDLKRIGATEIRERLAEVLAAEEIAYDTDALTMIARAADGGLRDALSLTDQVLSMSEGRLTVDRVRDALGLVPDDEYLALLDLVTERRAGDVFAAVARLAEAGVDFGVVLTGLADTLRAQLAIALGGAPGDVSERMREALAQRAGALQAADLLRMLHVLTELEPRFRKSGQQQLLIETTLVRLALLDRSVALEDVLRGLGGAGGGSAVSARGASAQAAAPRPPAGGAAGISAAPSSLPRGAAAADGPAPTSAAPVSRPVAAPAPDPRVERPVPRAAPAVEMPPERPSAAAYRPPVEIEVPDLHVLTERWDEVIRQVREAGRTMLATVLQHASPVAVTARGVATVQLDEPNELYEQAFEAGRDDVLAALRAVAGGIERVVLRRSEAAATPAAAPRRITDASIRQERTEALRRRDPLLDAAIDALDLEVLD